VVSRIEPKYNRTSRVRYLQPLQLVVRLTVADGIDSKSTEWRKTATITKCTRTLFKLVFKIFNISALSAVINDDNRFRT